jgi:hypothetical protein
MSDYARKTGNMLQNLSKSLLPTPSAERLIFRRFKGSRIADAVLYDMPLTEDDIETVILRVNPASVSFSKRKVIQKVQTSAPGRFIVFDWGSELTVLSIVGNTGNLLPASSFVEDLPLVNTLEDMVTAAGGQAGRVAQQGVGAIQQAIGNQYINPILQNTIMATSSYYETLQMSPKYKTFKNLEKMFDVQDADADILTLEFGDMAVYRGFFEDFTFDVSAESPWNWTYNLTYVILDDLTEKVRRWDRQFNRRNSNIQT